VSTCKKTRAKIQVEKLSKEEWSAHTVKYQQKSLRRAKSGISCSCRRAATETMKIAGCGYFCIKNRVLRRQDGRQLLGQAGSRLFFIPVVWKIKKKGCPSHRDNPEIHVLMDFS
jgi:hypothetical protein